jgi:DNA-directed RNA polymerase subunit beta'
MAVHVPLSIEAQMEARVLMMSTNNILSPAHGKPIIVPSQDIVLGIYYMTRERAFAKGEGKVFASPDEVRAAYDQGEVDLQAKVWVRMDGKRVETTVGRVLLYDIVPHRLAFESINKVMDKKQLQNLIDLTYRLCGEKETVLLADRIRTMGYGNATRAGISIALDNMVIPRRKQELLDRAMREVDDIHNQYTEGLITVGERYNKVIDIWAQVTEEVAQEMMTQIGSETATVQVNGKAEERKQPSFNPIYIMADSGARGSAQQIRQLAGMRGLMAKPSGEIIETPITANFREGLNVLQYFISTHGARKGLADTALKTANSGYLTRRLVDVAQDAIVTEYDCGAMDGIEMGALVEGGEIIEPMGERILGRVTLDDIVDPFSENVLVKANEEIDENRVKLIENAGIDKVKIRSVLTCQARRGICVECYGRDLARGHKVSVGEAVGVIAAQSIGEPGTQLTMRTFHIGGAASRRAEQSTVENRNPGLVRFHNVAVAKKKDGTLIVMNRNGELAITDEQGRERERYGLVYGAKIVVREGQKIEPSTLLAEWDPYSMPIITEVAGRAKFGDLVDGVTYSEQVDEITGLARKAVIASKDPDARPRISIKDQDGKTRKLANSDADARYMLPEGAILMVNEGDEVDAGEVLAKMPRETTKTKDITGGLPRVAELFEARKPKEHAVISEIDGVVAFGKDTKGKRKVVITPEVDGKLRPDLAKEYLIGKGKHISVHTGDRVRAGEPLMDGAANPHDILRVLGEKELARWLVDEVQEVYRLQGVKINDKHIETIVRQMLRRVRVVEVGETNFLSDEQVEKWVFEEENEKVIQNGGRPAQAEPLLLGITKASLSTESFISASSFQETTKVLTEAAISGKVDYLRGLKENVIMGRLIPAGTGLPHYKHLDIEVETPVDAVEEAEEALAVAADE